MQLNAFTHKEQKSRINKHRTLRFHFAGDPITARLLNLNLIRCELWLRLGKYTTEIECQNRLLVNAFCVAISVRLRSE